MKLDKTELKSKAATYGKLGVGFAIKAGIVYVLLVFFGLFAGGIGGYWLAAHFDYGGWKATLAAIIGVIAGGWGGFITAQIVVVGLVQDMLLDAGIAAGKVGYKKGRQLLQERREKAAAAGMSVEPEKTTPEARAGETGSPPR